MPAPGHRQAQVEPGFQVVAQVRQREAQARLLQLAEHAVELVDVEEDVQADRQRRDQDGWRGELARLCLLDGAAALARWRGHHLHRAVIAERAALAAALGRTLLLATVAPGNLPSLRGLLGEGFAIRRCALVYGGLERLLVLRDLDLRAPRWVAMRRVRADDYAAHQAALADGLFGFDYVEDEAGGGCVVYGRAEAATTSAKS